MKKTVVSLLAIATFFIVSEVNAQEFQDLDASPMDVAYHPDRLAYADLRARKITSPQIKLYYSRPQVKGREMIGVKEKFGKLWRMGANQANEITFFQDVNIGGTKVSAGTYSVFAVLGEKTWEFQLFSRIDMWGPFTLSDEEKANPVATVEGPVSKSDKLIEALSIYFKPVDGGVHMVVGWENTIAEMPIKF